MITSATAKITDESITSIKFLPSLPSFDFLFIISPTIIKSASKFNGLYLLYYSIF